jgi:HEPN domain-containing protein
LQYLTAERLRDAKTLLDGKRWAGAYYLAGYAVECGLKACIIGRLMSSDDFPERKFSEQCWTHDLIQLLRLAGLKDVMAAAAVADPELKLNWDIATAWTEASRYERISRAEAEGLFAAITDKKHGVLTWIKSHW